MPPILVEEEAGLDPYTLLNLDKDTAGGGLTDKMIKKAYRTMSLKYHPDKNSTPEAAIMFRKIQLSQEILLNPSKRQYIDDKLENEKKRRVKYAESDKKRKAMIDALEAREEDAKRARVDAVLRKKREAEQVDIEESGRLMREAAQKKRDAAIPIPKPTPKHTTSNISRQPEITPIDLTLAFTIPIASPLASSSTLESSINMRYGGVGHVILADAGAGKGDEGGKGKKKKSVRGVVEFAKGNWGGCWACWNDHQESSGSGVVRGLGEGVKVKWAKGSVPEWVAWAEGQSLVSGGGNGHVPDATMDYGSAPDLGGGISMESLLAGHTQRGEDERKRRSEREAFESLTLLSMRMEEKKREREKMEEEIMRQDEEEEALAAR